MVSCEANFLGNNIYEIMDANPDPEDMCWEFGKGSRVRCELKQLSDGEHLVACELVG